jgi:hypothetical protein
MTTREIARSTLIYFQALDEIKKAGGRLGHHHDNSISVLAHTAAANENYNKAIFLICSNIYQPAAPEMPQHAERTLPAVNESNKDEFIKVLKKRNDDLSGAAFTRLGRIIRLAEKIT